jgi:hypothetical protein
MLNATNHRQFYQNCSLFFGPKIALITPNPNGHEDHEKPATPKEEEK